MSGSIATVVIDGTDVSNYAVEGSVTKRLNRVGTSQVRIPMLHAVGGVGSMMKIYIDGVLWHHGRVLISETSADENGGYTVYNSSDPLEIWNWRPVRDPDGDFSDPTIIEDNDSGPQIIEAMVQNSENAGGGPPTDAEGPTRLALGAFAGGGVSLKGAPVDWPMTMADLASLLISTGELDVVVTPIEFDGDNNYGQLDCYNGDYGTDHTADVVFQYGFGLHNIRALRWNEDMTHMCNKLQYYLGPKYDKQHWAANITGTDPGLPDPPQAAILAARAASQTAYDVRMDIHIYDANGESAYRALYRRLWQIEAWLRQQPQTLVHITPTRDTEIGTFDIGDLVTVEADADVNGGFSGAQRVYEFTASWDADSVVTIGELQTSADNEGI